jgi:uncharacterized membrane protein YeaQ/YmgE (transglycosylase-associated protein family)
MRRLAMSFNKKLEDNNPYDKDAMKIDKNYKRPMQIISIIIGVLGAVILAVGMLMVTNQSAPQSQMWTGLAIGCVGAVVVSFNYSFYCTLVEKKAKMLLGKTEESEVKDDKTEDKPVEDEPEA